MEEVLYSAFCQGDQTICRVKNFLLRKFFMPSRLNQDLLPCQKSSLYPITEYHQT